MAKCRDSSGAIIRLQASGRIARTCRSGRQGVGRIPARRSSRLPRSIGLASGDLHGRSRWPVVGPHGRDGAHEGTPTYSSDLTALPPVADARLGLLQALPLINLEMVDDVEGTPDRQPAEFVGGVEVDAVDQAVALLQGELDVR